MHWLNGDGTVLWANQTELNILGYAPEEYIGQQIMDFCPDERELVLEIFKQLGSGNAIADVPVRFRTKDGKLVHLLIDSNVAYNPDGSFGHTRCFIRDDTARKIRDARTQLLLVENERVCATNGEACLSCSTYVSPGPCGHNKNAEHLSEQRPKGAPCSIFYMGRDSVLRSYQRRFCIEVLPT